MSNAPIRSQVDELVNLLHRNGGYIKVSHRATHSKAVLISRSDSVLFVTTNIDLINGFKSHPNIKLMNQNYSLYSYILVYYEKESIQDKNTQIVDPLITTKNKLEKLVKPGLDVDLSISKERLDNFSNYGSPIYSLWRSLGVSEISAKILTIKRVYPEQINLDKLKEILYT